MNTDKLLVFFIASNLAAVSGGSAAALTATNNGIYVVVACPWSNARNSSNRSIPYDQTFLWCPYSNVGYCEIYYSNPNYAFRMKMFGPDGKETAKTALGQQYGSRFDHAVDESDKASKGSGSINAQGRYDPEDGDRIPGRFLPSPKDMFQMDQNGLYRLEIEFQLNGPHKDTNQGGLELLRFPPLEIAVEKPLTAPFFVFSATNQGVYISIIGTKSNGLTGFDDGLQWRVFCESQYSMLHSLDLPSGFKMNLTGPDGKEVPKIGPGKTIGVNFEAVKTMEKLPPGAIASELNFTSGIGDIVGANPLQRIEDCFAMDKPGIYTLELQIQLFRNKYSAAGEPGPEELLRFPPMTIKLNRP